MDRYQRVEKPRAETPIDENEIRITSQGRMRNYITYAMTLLQDKGSDEIVFKAMGRAINKTVTIVELLKRRIVGLHPVSYTHLPSRKPALPETEGLLPTGNWRRTIRDRCRPRTQRSCLRRVGRALGRWRRAFSAVLDLKFYEIDTRCIYMYNRNFNL